MDKYTSLYTRPADAPAGPFTPKTPQMLRPGDTITRLARFTGTLANLDRLLIAGGFVAGEKVIRFVAIRDADPDAANTLAVDVGLVGNANKFVAASTGLQATTPLVIDETTLPFNTSAIDGDQVYLTAVTGAAATSVNHEFMVTSVYAP